MDRRPTIRDVAKEAGVAPMTVSNTLRGKPGVGEATRRRVLATAKRLNYHVNASASMLKTGKSGIVHIVVNEFDAPFYSKLVENLSYAATKHNLVPFPQQTRYSPLAAQQALTNSPLGQQLFDGEILHADGLKAGPQLIRLTRGRPTVLIDACQETPTIDAVELPNDAGSRAAVQHLIERGCRHIALVGTSHQLYGDPPHAVDAHALRLRAAADTLAQAGITSDPSHMFDGRDESTGVAAGHAIADHTEHFDGVWCTNDSAAIGVIRGLADRGLHVPQDLKVIGFDGVTTGSYTVPTLSTVAPDISQLAELVLDMLIRRIEEPDKHYSPTIATVGFTLCTRESTS